MSVSFLPEALVNGTLAVEVAWGSSPGSIGSWTDITTDVYHSPGISVSAGKSDEQQSSSPAQCTFTLSSPDARYLASPLSANHPNVRQGTPVRVRIDPGTGVPKTAFFGYVQEWAPSWEAMGDIPQVMVTAAGYLRNLQKPGPVQSAIRRSSSRQPSVIGYWPMEEGETSTEFASGLSGGVPLKNQWGGQADFAADSETFKASLPLPKLQTGGYDAYPLPPYTDTGELFFRFLIAVPEAGIPNLTHIAAIHVTGGTLRVIDLLYLDSPGVYLRVSDTNGNIVKEHGIGIDLPGNPGLFHFYIYQNGSNINYTMGMKNIYGTDGSASSSISSQTLGQAYRVLFNFHQGLGDTVIGHAILQNGPVYSQDVVAAAEAYRGWETVDERLDRVMSEESIPIHFTESGNGEFLGDQLNKPILDILRDVETTDHGMLYDGVGDGLTFRSKEGISNQDPMLTLDASLGHVSVPLDLVADDANLVNQQTVKRSLGGTVVYEDVDGPLGTETVGVYAGSTELNLYHDINLNDHASWMVYRGTQEGYRIPSVTVDLLANPSLAASALEVLPGDRIDVTNLSSVLSGYPDLDFRLLVLGIRYSISPHHWTATFNTVPYDPYVIAEVSTNTSPDTNEFLFRADTSGSAMNTTAAQGATSISVKTLAGPLWTTSSTDCPFVLDIGGIPVTVTAVTGSSSPQTMTVSGVVKSLPVNTDVKLWNPPTLGI